MRKPIVVISASNMFSKVSKKVIDENNLQHIIEVVESTGEDSLKIALDCIKEGTEIFIARGRNVMTLRSNLSVPVINVQYIYEDFYYSIKKTNTNIEDIILVGFDEVYSSLKTFKEISGLNVKLVQPKSTKTMEKDILTAVSSNTKALIGGLTVQKTALNLGLKYFTFNVEPTSILLALESAINVYNVQNEKTKNLKILSTTIDSISDVIFNIDINGNIIFRNNLSKELLNQNIIDKIWDTISSLNYSTNKNFEYEYIETIRDKTYMVKINPIIINKELQSYIIALSDTEIIQEKERKIRMELRDRGHIAKNKFSNIIGISNFMKNTKEFALKYSKSDNPVLIFGETGTGKELFAQSIHNASKRKNEPFIAINCAALPKSLLESELFGYVKGAFTGASNEGKKGVFEAAHGGTVFLDEIGEMDITVQAKLLRVLQEKEISRLGDNKIIPVDIRIISATNKSLEDLIKDNLFREDLYYRLAVLKLDIPPLRARFNDIPFLIKEYLQENYKDIQFSESLINKLSKLEYKGNVRELFNLLERIIVLTQKNKIELEDYNKYVDIEYYNINDSLHDNDISSLKNTNENVEKNEIIRILNLNKGNRNLTAKDLSISTTTLWRKMKKYGII